MSYVCTKCNGHWLTKYAADHHPCTAFQASGKPAAFPVQTPWHMKASRPWYPTSIPWALIEPHRKQAGENHDGQSLEMLASRGGLDVVELYFVLRDIGIPAGYKADLDAAATALMRMLGREMPGEPIDDDAGEVDAGVSSEAGGL